MANYNNQNMIGQPQNNNNVIGQPQPIQFPYGNNNMLLNNVPYDNYMGRMNGSQNLLPPQQYLKCRPVSSKEEARACQIDLDGSLWVFTDLGNNKIYTKQINNDGTATFKTYTFSEDENPYNSNEYVTKDEFNKVIQTLLASIQQQQNTQGQEQTKQQSEKSGLMNF